MSKNKKKYVVYLKGRGVDRTPWRLLQMSWHIFPIDKLQAMVVTSEALTHAMAPWWEGQKQKKGLSILRWTSLLIK